jgi:hypothetical protein
MLAIMMEKLNFLRLKYFFAFFLVAFAFPLVAQDQLYLRENLKKAKVGDYIVTAQNKTYTLLLIYDKNEQVMTIEEITAPIHAVPSPCDWKSWVGHLAPGHTSWVRYVIDLSNGEMKEYFSFTKNGWYDIPQADNFLSTLLNMHFLKVPLKDRKKVGPPPTRGSPDWRPYWQPKMIVDGQFIQGVLFDAWRTHWPKDGTELSGKAIEVFIPQESDFYPSYFPYWLQISGVIGKAKIRIVDSGHQLASPRAPLQG